MRFILHFTKSYPFGTDSKRYPGTVDYEFEAEADVFNLLDANNNVIATISEQEMIDTLNLLGERSAKEGEEQ